MKIIVRLLMVITLGVIVYNAVEEPVRAKFDNGYEEQMITLRKWRNDAYLVVWEFLGAYDTEVAAQRATWDNEIANRRLKLQQRREQTERMPAFVPKSNYEKFLAK